ncbi:MAG TPA: Do family serine endopeptidase [Stellaceae bacterium]|nr:Do family serine endopeptidase [Stellaceae bacterium]
MTPIRSNRHPQPRAARRLAGAATAAAVVGAAALAALAAGLWLPPPVLAQTPAAGGGNNVSRQVQRDISIPLPSLAPLVERVSPAVVNVSAQLNGDQAASAQQESDLDDGGNESFPASPFDQMLRRFFENQAHPHEQVVALGSGFVIDPKGDIVTNNHVVGNSDKVTVILQDGSREPAKVVGRDEKTDIALLKINVGHDLPFVDWGNSDASKVGDWVVAVGNPFGLGGTVTAGIVSAIGRNIDEGPYDDFIQIDAPINRGNSGGPTFNLSGQVIGINTAIYSPSGGSVGIGFAIPSNIAKQVVEQLENSGHVTRGWLGVAIQGITPTIEKSLDLKTASGALVSSVTPDSPAAKVGLKPGDVIVGAGGRPIDHPRDLPRVVAAAPIGKPLDLTVRRQGNQMTLSPVIAELKPQEPQQAAAQPEQNQNADGSPTALGLELTKLDPTLRRRLHLSKDVDGVVVSRVEPDSPAGALGILPGDVIQSVDQKPATTPKETARLLQQGAASGSILLLLNRHGTSQFVGLSVGGANQPG